ncbi:MAG TPA: amino acid--[acyl-carrier-protein] ligase [Vineibacter sp.]|nr:amino acid--[acyl-carrier-protein] ligase [Vineibacter sp.]
MSADASLQAAQAAFRDELIAHGLLLPMGVDGLYGRSGVFEDVIERFNDLVTRHGGNDGAEVMRFPPAINRQHFEESDYLKSFPQLAGTIHSFMGNDRDHAALIEKLLKKEDWTPGQKATQVVMTPAACYPLYPVLASRGALPANGALTDVYSYCFRHEPSIDPARMQLFRQREYVRVGTPDQVMAFRQLWIDRGTAIMSALGVPLTVDVANDPFFGRAGKMLAVNQRDQTLKFELLIPITSTEKPTACLSFNYHQDHFGHVWNIRTHDGGTAHTACVGFGVERIALALFKYHGFDVKAWPQAVRQQLWG